MRSKSEDSNDKESSEGGRPNAFDRQKRAARPKHPGRLAEGKEVNLPPFSISWKKGLEALEESEREAE